MFMKINSVWTALGVMLALVALYLVLDRSQDAVDLFRGGAGALGGLFGILQGRDVDVAYRASKR